MVGGHIPSTLEKSLMKKSLMMSLLAPLFGLEAGIVPNDGSGSRRFREGEPGADGAAAGETTPATDSKTREITMADGRKVPFGENTRMKKDYGIRADGSYAAWIDFDNGQTIESVLF